MPKRRTNAEIEEVEKIHDATRKVADDISDRINTNDDDDRNYIGVTAASYWHVRAEYQKDVASDLVVSFRTKDAALMEHVARAMRKAADEYTSGLVQIHDALAAELKAIEDQADFDERPWDETLAAKEAVRARFAAQTDEAFDRYLKLYEQRANRKR